MRLRICTWNVNSVRLRAEQAARFVAEQAPDVLCMQEIKCREGEFPREAFIEMGLPHLKIAGQKGWHGVAIASRLPIEDPAPLDVCREGHARCVGVKVAGGVRTAKDAVRYLVLVKETAGPEWLTPALFRIGASSLLNDLLMQRSKQLTGAYAGPDYFTLD